MAEASARFENQKRENDDIRAAVKDLKKLTPAQMRSEMERMRSELAAAKENQVLYPYTRRRRTRQRLLSMCVWRTLEGVRREIVST